jgi:hypothetical protein
MILTKYGTDSRKILFTDAVTRYVGFSGIAASLFVDGNYQVSLKTFEVNGVILVENTFSYQATKMHPYFSRHCSGVLFR